MSHARISKAVTMVQLVRARIDTVKKNFDYQKIGRYYLESLIAQDEIEDDESLSNIQKLTDKRWESKVLSSLMKVAELLNMNEKWAYETTEFF